MWRKASCDIGSSVGLVEPSIKDHTHPVSRKIKPPASSPNTRESSDSSRPNARTHLRGARTASHRAKAAPCLLEAASFLTARRLASLDSRQPVREGLLVSGRRAPESSSPRRERAPRSRSMHRLWVETGEKSASVDSGLSGGGTKLGIFSSSAPLAKIWAVNICI